MFRNVLFGNDIPRLSAACLVMCSSKGEVIPIFLYMCMYEVHMMYSGVAGKSAGSSGCRLRGWKMKVKSFLRYLISWELELRELFKEITCG
jgi:hypothetical protein